MSVNKLRRKRRCSLPMYNLPVFLLRGSKQESPRSSSPPATSASSSPIDQTSYVVFFLVKSPMRAVRDGEGGSISRSTRCFALIYQSVRVLRVIQMENVTAYRIWDSDEPNLGVLIVLNRIPLERPDVDGVVEQHGTLRRFIRPMWVVSLVFPVVCSDNGNWFSLFLR